MPPIWGVGVGCTYFILLFLKLHVGISDPFDNLGDMIHRLNGGFFGEQSQGRGEPMIAAMFCHKATSYRAVTPGLDRAGLLEILKGLDSQFQHPLLWCNCPDNLCFSQGTPHPVSHGLALESL